MVGQYFRTLNYLISKLTITKNWNLLLKTLETIKMYWSIISFNKCDFQWTPRKYINLLKTELHPYIKGWFSNTFEQYTGSTQLVNVIEYAHYSYKSWWLWSESAIWLTCLLLLLCKLKLWLVSESIILYGSKHWFLAETL